MTPHQAAQKAVEALKAAQRAINSMKVEAETAAAGGDEQMLQDACETISAEGLEADTELRAAIAALPSLQQQPEPVATLDIVPMAEPRITLLPARSNLSLGSYLLYTAPPALQEVPRQASSACLEVGCAVAARERQEVPREPVASLLRGLVNHWNEFGPEHGLDEMMDAAHRYLAASPSTTQQPSVDHALNTTPVVDHATQQQEAGSCDIVTLGGGIPGDPSGELTAICKGLVSAVAYGEHREVSALFDAPEQAHAFVRYLQRFVGNGVAAAPSTPAREEAGLPAVDSQTNPPADGGGE